MLEVEKKIATKKLQNNRNGFADSENMPLKTIILMRSQWHLVYGILKHWKRTSGNFTCFKTKWGICNSRNPDKTPYKQGYNLYSKNILPLIGKLF
jgi:demethylmenaquinone methyltransferase/2-methoxy-6-polyprenyl-1,4-benzoquinol methylase